VAEGEDGGAAVLVKLEHFYWVAKIEVEDLVGCEAVHLGKGSWLEEIVDGGAGGALAAGEIDWDGRGVSAAEVAAFDGVGKQTQEGFDFVSGHDHRCYGMLTVQ
jgi:hypothetical protein